MSHVFTPNQLRDYERDGFLVCRNFYTADEMLNLGRRIDAFAAQPPVRGKQMAYYEKSLKNPGQKILSRIEKFVECDPYLRDFALSKKMTDAAAALLGEPVLLFKEKVNFKLPGGGGFEPHQDIQPGWDDYAPFFLSVLVTIDDSTVENGCLELSAGHHKRGLLGEKWKPLTPEQLAGISFQAYPMAPGDVAFFDCFVPHQSKPNLTDKPRRNLYLTFNRRSDGDHRERYFADKRRSYPPDFEREAGKEYVFRV